MRDPAGQDGRHAARLLMAVGALVLVGCATGPARVVVPNSGGVRLEQGAQLGWATKRLATKVAPTTLVAADGTICRVAPERYAHTDPQALVWCEWQPGAPVPK